MVANAAVFYIDWDDLQLNLPNPFVPAQFYIANVGGARAAASSSRRRRGCTDGRRVRPLGYTRARFDDDSTSSGVPVGGNDIPNTPRPRHRRDAGACTGFAVGIDLYGRAEVVSYGSFKYDDLNIEGQDAYALTNLRFGARGDSFRRGLDPERVRHALHSAGVRLRAAGAVRLHRRDGPPPHVRGERRGDVLGAVGKW